MFVKSLSALHLYYENSLIIGYPILYTDPILAINYFSQTEPCTKAISTSTVTRVHQHDPAQRVKLSILKFESNMMMSFTARGHLEAAVVAVVHPMLAGHPAPASGS